MIELIEKATMIGIGAMALGQKKGEELVAEFREKCGLSEEEGRALVDKLKAQAEAQSRRLTELAEVEVQKACERLGVVRREEYERLLARIEALEKQRAG